MQYQKKLREIDRPKIVKIAKTSLRSKEGKRVLDYLKYTRGFSEDIIDQFDFGYCPENINHFLRGRIITPIYDTYGSLIALSTRHLDESRKDKFWHESFDKGSYLYGLCYSKNDIMKHKKAILVEGEFDVAALHTMGFKMTVGVCGSAFTLLQASLLSRYCSIVYIVFDGDEAGKKGTKRILYLYKKYNLDAYKIVYIPVELPDGKDPNNYTDKDEFKNILVDAKKQYMKDKI